MLVEIEVYDQNTNVPILSETIGYNGLAVKKKIINTDEILEMEATPMQHPENGNVWILPYRNPHTYPILTTKGMVIKLRELLGVVPL